MERLSPAALRRRTWLLSLIGLALLASGPHNLSILVSAVGSIVTFPLTGTLEASGGAYEVGNLELLLVYVIVVIGMNLFFQTGLFSLGHTVFFIVGGYTVAYLTVEHQVSFWLAFPAGALLAGAVGVVLALPAARLGAFTFAMITLGYAIVAGDLLLQWDTVTGGGDGLLGVTRPQPFDTLESYYWLIAICVAVSFVAGRNLLRSPFGRSAKAIATSAVAAQSLGIDPSRVKVRSFALSAVFAGAAGALFGPLIGFLSPSSFSLDLAILFLLMVLLGGAGTVVGPVIGAVVLFRIPLAVESVTDQPGDVSLLVYGLVLIASVYVVPQGLMSAWWRLRAWAERRLGRAGAPQTVPAGDRAGDLAAMVARITAEGETGVAAGPALRVADVRLNLGGVQALDGTALEVAPGTVHALIGPNGSGKTTLLNVISGYAEPDAGTVEIGGRVVGRAAPQRRVGLGVARTFQTPYVFEGVSCSENVLVALDHNRRAGFLSHLVRSPRARAEERRRYDEACELLRVVGLGARIDDDAAALPPGDRRLLELARVLALRPRLVLMDEPAGGLNPAEIHGLARFVEELRRQGVAVLLVEHHMDLVMRLADRITVLNLGRDISTGTPDEVRSDPAVLAGYLGDDLVASTAEMAP